MEIPTYSENVLETVGQTPLVRLNRIPTGSTQGTILATVDSFNPGGSVKDRVGLAIVEDAERRGLLRPGGTIVESTSGNTGMGLALAAIVKGYHCVFVMPDKMSEEKVRLLRALGARVVITPTAVAPDDPRSYYKVAQRIVDETPNAILANQYHNPANPQAHYASTGPELWEGTAGKIAVLVAGMGTGGTISGTGRYLKERNPDIKIVGVDIEGSLLFETWKQGRLPADPHPKTYKIEGIGEDFLPSTMDLGVIDEVVQVDDRESFQMTRRLVREEGLFVGGSSGSAVAGLLKSDCVRELKPGQIAVVLLPDSGDRYLSKIFDDNWMRENGFMEPDRADGTVASLLRHRKELPLVTAAADERVTSVVEKMKKFDISQLPVVDGERRLIGVISEADLLDHLLHADHVHDPQETIGPFVNPNIITVSRETSVQKVSAAFEQGKVAAVTEEGRLVGMLTKIDLIDYLYGNL
jgi:cystathionine beta-synthase